MMDIDVNTLGLLKAIQRNLPLSTLQSDGLLFIQIAKILEDCLSRDLLKYSEDGILEITDIGRFSLYQGDKRNHYGNSGWIDPLDAEKIPQVGVDDIYIPTRHMLELLKRGG